MPEAAAALQVVAALLAAKAVEAATEAREAAG